MSFSKLVEKEQKEMEQKIETNIPKPMWQSQDKTFSQVKILLFRRSDS